jgi:hypothetical protein
MAEGYYLMLIIMISILIFLINIPFGFWRSYQSRFSLKWLIAIHAPVIISIVIRMITGVQFKLMNLLIFIPVFFIGQLTGKLIHRAVINTK